MGIFGILGCNCIFFFKILAFINLFAYYLIIIYFLEVFMKRIRFILGFFLLSTIILFADTSYELLGKREVDFKADKDTIIVTAKEGVFTKLRFTVKGNEINILKIIVTYGNTEKDELDVKWNFDKGESSREIDLKGNTRFINKIDLFYKTVGKIKDGKAFIRV